MNDTQSEVERLRAQMIKDVKFLTQKPNATGWDLADQLAAFESAIRAESAAEIAFQGTPTPEQIEAHAKAWPIKGANGGYWLRSFLYEGRRIWPEIFNLRLDENSGRMQGRVATKKWSFVEPRKEDQWLPLQPNGVPVASGCAACAEKAYHDFYLQCIACGTDGELSNFHAGDHTECPSCHEKEFYVIVEPLVDALKEPQSED